MAKSVLTDTCFWIGLLDPTDQHHEKSLVIADLIEGHTIIFPWPCLYETLSTHLARRRDQLLVLEELLKKPDVVLLEDAQYKSEAMKEVFEFNRIRGHSFSLADSVIREMLRDVNVKVQYLATFNAPDFADVCAFRKIEIID